MRVERWYWLIAFCVVSFFVHIGIVAEGPGFGMPTPHPRDAEIIVSLQPEHDPAAKPDVKSAAPPTPIPHPEAKTPSPVITRAMVRRAVARGKMVTVAKVPREHVRKSGTPAAGSLPMPDDKPAPLGLPTAPKTAVQPRAHIALNNAHAGGGTPSPSVIPDGKGGAPGPEAPPEEVLFNHGGKGGKDLPKVAPSTGGGGGNSILSVENPLAKQSVPEEKPGAGPGIGGNLGAGSGGGVGFAKGKGIGTNPNGKVAVGSLSNAAGQGNGNASGNGTGTRAPGGGHGTGAELPGTGGDSTTGYGRGKGTGVGNGAASGTEGNGSPSFGDVAGLLGGKGRGSGGTGQGGGGDPGRGSVFGAKPRADSKGAVHIVYVLDISGSMQDGNKIGKAKEVLKEALLGLKPGDTFNIVTFCRDVRYIYPDMLPAEPDILSKCMDYVDRLRLGPGTNMSGAMEVALRYDGATQIYLMSDGEPNYGIQDPQEMRAFIHDHNKANIRVSTMGLCLGEKYPGERLMRGIAADTAGTYSYINMRLLR
ncbi:MAG: Vault protein inter-alpha-trypsin domain protein [Chthonomonadaceae bacterium]|nr:Vault protein inter-alpha-trypsin domain protein [Chthonomonadaceae bacterium]